VPSRRIARRPVAREQAAETEKVTIHLGCIDRDRIDLPVEGPRSGRNRAPGPPKSGG